MQQKDNAGLFARLTARLKTDKRFAYLLYGVAAALALLLYAFGAKRESCQGKVSAAETAAPTAIVSSKDALETRLESVLSAIRGAGKVRVLVTYETSGELVTATSRSTDTSLTESGGERTQEQSSERVEPATVTTDEGETPIVLMETEPTLRGVVVVAEGACDLSVKLDLQRAVRAVTGLALERIEVFEMAHNAED